MSTNSILASAPLTSTNYILKATGTTIGNSLIWDNGTNVGIGNTNTSYTLDVTGTGRFTSTLLVSGAATFSSTYGNVLFKGTNASTMWTEYYYNTSTLLGYIGGGSGILSGANASDFIVRSEADLVVATGNNRRMTITSGGNVRVNSTTDINGRGVVFQVSGSEVAQFYGYGNGYGIGLFMCPNSAATGTHTAIAFRSPANGDVGSITTTSSATLYNVSSDYRLKQDFKEYNGLDLISAIKTYDYEWKSDNTRAYGVLAHELQEVLPYAVTGEKDNKEMQGVDYSKIVPILVKGIQEQQVQIQNLQEQINILAK